MPDVIITGQLKEIKDAQIVGQGFEVREFWVEEIGVQYPQTYSIQATQGKCNVLDQYSIGDIVECRCNLRGRYWSKNGKDGVMNSIQMWQIQRIQNAPQLQTYQQQAAPPRQQSNDMFSNNQDDQLPF